jgi:hypothetical protein
MLNSRLLYHDVIETDGKIRHEETFLGALLAAVLIVGICLIIFLLVF